MSNLLLWAIVLGILAGFFSFLLQKNIRTIFSREFKTYFNSPIGYIYIIVFLLINSSLFITPFFLNPQADMRSMFNFLPFFCCVLIPLITMRLWAEDRKENTIEMLLTFPMQPYHLVLGKYLAGLFFFILVLASTWTIPFMLGKLGRPDWGMILSSYLGALMLGAFFLAVGSFLSALVKDQIIAAVLAIMACFGLFLIGTDFIAMAIDASVSGLGSLLRELLGVTTHYESFTRGIIAIVDVIYFIVWISIFLFLNGLFLEGRNRPNSAVIFSTGVVVCIFIGIFFNYLFFDMSLGRFDCTEGKIYTVSDATLKILSGLKIPVNVNVYITPKDQMPTEMKTLEQDIVDKLNEMRIASNGKLQYNPIHLEVKQLVKNRLQMDPEEKPEKPEKTKAAKSLEETLLDKGVQPFSVQIFKGDQHSTQLVYSSIGIAYKEKKEEILPQVTSRNLYDLEYQLISTIYRLVRERKPVVALVAPKDEVPAHIRQFMMQMGRPVPESQDPYELLEKVLDREGYEVKRVDLSKKEPLPESYDALAVIHPKEMSERQKWELSRAIASGKNVLVAVQQYSMNYTMDRGYMSIDRQDQNPAVNEKWLKEYGVSINEDYLMDESNITLTISDSSNPLAMLVGGHQLKLPNHILVNAANMNQQVSITNRISQLPYLWGTALDIDKEKIKENKLEYTILLQSSPKSWKVHNGIPLSDDHFKPEYSPILQQYPLMVMLEGQFPDLFKGKERPNWPKPPQADSRFSPPEPEDKTPEPPVSEIKPAPGKLLLLGCATIFRKEFLQNSVAFFMNCIDTLALSSDLVKIRSHRMVSRRIDLPSNSGMWKLFNYAFMPMLVLLAGIIRTYLRTTARNDYLSNLQLEA